MTLSRRNTDDQIEAARLADARLEVSSWNESSGRVWRLNKRFRPAAPNSFTLRIGVPPNMSADITGSLWVCLRTYLIVKLTGRFGAQAVSSIHWLGRANP